MNKIKFLRELNNMSQAEVANKLFMSQNTYSRYEADPSKLTNKQYEELATLYAVTVEALKNEEPFIVITNSSTSHSQKQSGQAKELIDQLIESKNETIRILQNEIEYLKKSVK